MTSRVGFGVMRLLELDYPDVLLMHPAIFRLFSAALRLSSQTIGEHLPSSTCHEACVKTKGCHP